MSDPALANHDANNFLFLSAHDFRSPRKASIHFVAQELAKLGTTRFFSLRYSHLSRYKQDPRLSLDNFANTLGQAEGVDCYLWKTLIHPFNTRKTWLKPIENLMYRHYSQGHNKVLRQWISEATVILFESGIAPIFFDLVKALNPTAKTIYLASDSLEAINVADYVHRVFGRVATQFNTMVLKSRALADDIPSKENLAFIPQGIDHSIANKADPSPYPEGVHAVSVGSMLFDPEFFVIASKIFPEIHFHIIGSGHPRHEGYGDNVTVYGEMPFDKTLPYIKHAKVGIAPYCSSNLPPYLRDTSLKLTQYAFFGLPAVCPTFIAADYPERFGYTLGDAASIKQAMLTALNTQELRVSQQFLSWREVAERTLHPEQYSDTFMRPQS